LLYCLCFGWLSPVLITGGNLVGAYDYHDVENYQAPLRSDGPRVWRFQKASRAVGWTQVRYGWLQGEWIWVQRTYCEKWRNNKTIASRPVISLQELSAKMAGIEVK